MMPSLEGRPRSAPTGSTGTIARRRCPQAKAPLRFFGFQIVQSRCGRRFRLATGVRRGGRSSALRGRRCGVSSSRRAGALRHHARRVCCRAEQSHDRRRAAARRRSLARRVRTTRKVAFSCRSCAGKRRESRGSLSERNGMKNFGGAPELKERRISWPDCLELMACAVSQMWS